MYRTPDLQKDNLTHCGCVTVWVAAEVCGWCWKVKGSWRGDLEEVRLCGWLPLHKCVTSVPAWGLWQHSSKCPHKSTHVGRGYPWLCWWPQSLSECLGSQVFGYHTEHWFWADLLIQPELLRSPIFLCVLCSLSFFGKNSSNTLSNLWPGVWSVYLKTNVKSEFTRVKCVELIPAFWMVILKTRGQ